MKMQLRQPQGWQRLMQQFAALPPVSWVYSYTLHHIDGVLMWLSGGRLTASGVLAGLPVVKLTTRGAKSGQPRTVPVIAIPDGDKFVLIASHWGRKRHPAWYHNLRANPEVTLSIEGRTATYVAREVADDEREAYWQRAVAIYPGYAAYKQRTGGRQIPVMVLTPKA
ncbi:MAG TPA: nitroreductase family deazaflavin-dependent oxidoreductase [Anaerolineales bacterium]|nr:nitroreductase family deazaflavin-dependent oxidoreductase [Anaerolineales bacterium]